MLVLTLLYCFQEQLPCFRFLEDLLQVQIQVVMSVVLLYTVIDTANWFISIDIKVSCAIFVKEAIILIL